ncbi:MAG: hypothetical protein WC708_17665 [Lentisphaeria bacterium]
MRIKKNVIIFILIIFGILLLLILDLIDGKNETEKLVLKQAESYGINNPVIINHRHKYGQVNSLMQYAIDIYYWNSKNYGIVLESNKKIYYCDYDYKTKWWLIYDDNDKIINID